MARRRDAASASRHEEIVEEIILNRRPLKPDKTLASVSDRIRLEIEDLLEVDSHIAKMSARKENVLYAKKLRSVLSKLEDLLISAPSALLYAVFNPLPPKYYSYYDLKQPLPYNSPEEIEQACLTERNAFIVELKRLHKLFNHAAKTGLVHHSNYAHKKHMCARLAWYLLTEWSQQRVTGTADGPFRSVASLLYEAGTGINEADLKRACDDVIKSTGLT